MSRKIFHSLVPVEDVLKIIEKYYPLKPLGTEEVDLLNAINRVLAEDIYAPIDHPPFDRSDVDGYAVYSKDLYGVDEIHPRVLKVIDKVEPGEMPKAIVKPGKTIEVATGAMIPKGADAVVMIEYTERIGDSVKVYKSVVPGENISTTGSDISLGDLVLQKGTIITSKEIGLLAGLGIKKVKVYRKPKIAVFSTGNEVIEPGAELIPGKIYDVNGYLLTTMLNELGASSEFLGKLPDNYDVVYEKIASSLKNYDIVITSGGTSAGLGDLIYKVFDNMGKPGVIIHGLLVKPGKPTVIAVADNKLLIGLPGFPLSCYMIAHLIVKPIILRLLGVKEIDTRTVKAKLSTRIRKPLGRSWLLPVSLIKQGEEYIAYPITMKSGSISPLSYSDGFAILDRSRDLYLEGEIVDIILFDKEYRIPSLVIIGSNDVLLYRIINEAGLAGETKIINVGSLGGWNAIKNGEADIAPTHLLDEDTLEYNTPFIKKTGLSDKAVLIRGYDRRIGIVVAKGNPKNIRNVEDFLRDDVTIVNRTKGSGTRTLLDILLKKMAKEKGIKYEEIIGKIHGYTYEVKTHTAVAKAIIHGRADAGIAIEYVARIFNLDFIPLSWEHFDFLVNKASMGKRSVKTFIEMLRSDKIKALINNTPGYRTPHDIGEIIG